MRLVSLVRGQLVVNLDATLVVEGWSKAHDSLTTTYFWGEILKWSDLQWPSRSRSKQGLSQVTLETQFVLFTIYI